MSSTQEQLDIRRAAADKYDSEWPLRTTMGKLAREGFLAGWDAARESSLPLYTLADLERLGRDYCDDATSAARLDDRLRLSLFIAWLGRKEREANDHAI